MERLDPAEAAVHAEAWSDLVSRALEPNVFLDPDFALPAARHLAGRPRPCFVLIWADDAGGARRLVAVCPVVTRAGARRLLASAWFHDLSTLGFPLLDRDRAVAALRVFLAWAGQNLGGASGVLVPSLPADGPTAAALREAAVAGGLGMVELRAWQRAALRRGGRPAGLPALSSKAAKEVRRQRRRLAERGTLAYGRAEAGPAVRDGMERFLALEASGWKGAAGTALLSGPGRTAFARTATRLLAHRGLCSVDSLTLDGAPIAMAVILSAGDVDFLWKIAYREDVAQFSPGVQLLMHITDAQSAAGRSATDSCAMPGHPMIDRLWPDRIRLCDLAVALRPGGSAGFRLALAVERAAARLRAGLKRAVLAWPARPKAGGASRRPAAPPGRTGP